MTAIILFLGAILKKLFKKGTFEEYSVSLSDEKFTTYMERFFRRQKLPQKGGAIAELSLCKKKINKTYKYLSKKALKGDLYEFEKWLYENHYYISGFFNVDLSDLPQIDGVPRILLIAREVLKVSAYKFDEKRVKEAIYLQNAVNPLTYNEICNLQNAFAFAYLEKISIVSEKAELIGELEKLASRKSRRFDKYLKSNFIRYFKAQREGMKTSDEIVFAVNSVIVELTKVVSETLTGLRLVGTADFSECYMPLGLLKGEPLFLKMTQETQDAYKRKIQELSDKLNLSEMIFTEKLLALAKTEHVHFGEYLFYKNDVLFEYIKRGKIVEHKDYVVLKQNFFIAAYTSLLIIMSTLIGILSFALFDDTVDLFKTDILNVSVLNDLLVLRIVGAVIMSVLGMFAVNKFVLKLLLAVSSVFSKKRPVFKMMEFNGTVLVVVSQFISEEKQLLEAYEKFNVLKSGSHSEKIRYAMLIDLPKSDTESSEFDKRIIGICKNYDGIFIRKKISEGKSYSAKERKRGAISDLNEALISGNFKKFTLYPSQIEKPEFVVVLDDDSTLPPAAINKAVCEMEHPLNQRFDMMNFGARYNLFSLKTTYSKRFLDCAGVDYNSASGFYFDNFDVGIFCGKGIYRLEQFYKKLICRIPEKRVLSHDVLEGGFLSTGQSSVYVYEDAPLNKESDEERKIRWTKGDLLNFSFIFKKDINHIIKLILFDLAMKPFSDVAFLFMLIWSFCTLSLGNILLTLSVLIIPYVIDLFAYFSNSADFRVVKKIKFVLSLLFRFIEDLLSAVQRGLSSLALIISTAYRLTTKKNVLSWKTFYQSQKSGGKLTVMAVPTVLFVTALGVAGYFVSSLILLNVFFYLAFFVILYVFYNASSEACVIKSVSNREKDLLEKWGKQTYKYFESFTVGGLPCDNFQEFAGVGRAMRTSPTNIGFLLLSCVSAYYLGYVSYDEAEKKIESTVLAVENLEKWNGNLYNWYDIESGKKLNGFVSSVDSGNFLSCLIVVKNFLKKGDLKFKVEKLIAETKLGKLFDLDKNQFFIGYNTENNKAEGHYDLISSEAKLTILTAIGLGEIDADAFYGVSRRSSDGITLSWSGTAFEYLMPELFLNSVYGSEFYYTKKKVVKLQRKSKCSGFWGISESGYAEVIDNVYQYFAFGLNNLSLRSRRNECVISPYSSFLALCSNPKAAIKNLEKLEKEAFSCYGFYEAIDFSKGQTVLSYMAHHQGMCMAAIANAVKDNIIVRLYNEDYGIKAASLLLTEPEISVKGEKLKREKFAYSVTDNVPIVRVVDKKYIEPKMNGHFGRYSVVIDDAGEGYSYCDGIYITRRRKHRDLPYGAFIIAENSDGQKFSPTFCPLKSFDDYEVVFKRNKSEFLNKTRKAKMTVVTNPLFNGELRRFEFETSEKLKFAFYADMALNDYAAETAHTAFSDLMIKTELVGKDLILASRYNADFCAGLLVKGSDFTPITKKTDFFKDISHNFSDVDISDLINFSDSVGDVINPMLGCAFECEPVNGKIVFDLIFCFGKSRNELLKYASMARSVSFYDFMLTGIKRDEMSENALILTQTILPKLLFKEYSAIKLRDITPETDSKYLSSKNLYYQFTGDLVQLKELGLVVESLKSAGVGVELIVGYYEDDNYYTPIKNMLKKASPKAVFVSENHSEWRNKSFMCLNNLTVITNEQYVLKSPNLKKISSLDFDGKIVLKSGLGGFLKSGGYMLPANVKTHLPYSNVVCSKNGGFVSTNNGTAFSYLKNSRLNRVTKFIQDGSTAPSSERLYVLWQNKWANVFESNYIVLPKMTKRIFKHDLFECEVAEYLCKDGNFKVTEVCVKNVEGTPKLLMAVDVALGEENPQFLTSKTSGESVYFSNVKNGQNCAFRVVGGKAGDNKAKYECRLFNFPFETKSQEINMGAMLEIEISNGKTYYFVSGDINGIENLTVEDFKAAKADAGNYAPPFILTSPDEALDKLFEFIPVQVESSRFYGKCGYYQTGGAIGFRDQLQDSLCQMYSDKNSVRKLILDCAAHQYEQGDVQHWWHEPKHGVRTKITDDRLFLPFVTAEYVKYSEDYSILTENIGYLSSPLLDGKSRYEIPQTTAYKESLLEHIKKAINSAFDLGENGLIKIKGGDWNDALDEVGNDEKGESVWLTEFMVLTLEAVKDFYDNESKIQVLDAIEKLKSALSGVFFEDRFARLITKDGEWFGVKGGTIEIDAISQAFAAMIDLDKQKVKKALDSALSLLFDEDKRIIKLLSPPIDKEGYGYISNYPPGVRENGGQYTHGAVWLALGFLEYGDCETAYKLLKAINPVERSTDKKIDKSYMGEPYVLAGDVYTNKDNYGRMGWSWYTGSAAWYYVAVIKMLGVRISGNNLILKPKLPFGLDGAKLKFLHNDSEIEILYHKSETKKIKINGVFYEGIEAINVLPDKKYSIEIYC